MTVLADWQIRALCIKRDGSTLEHPMIFPFEDTQIRNVGDQGVISYGLGSYGYDLRVGNKFQIFTNINSVVIDPKNFDRSSFIEMYKKDGDYILIPPNSFALCASREEFDIPRNLLVICIGKSTYARTGIVVNVTPLEPQWKGFLTIEVSNTTPLPAKIYAGEGLAQLVFLKADAVCEVSYADRKGKYQMQGKDPQVAKV